MSQLTQARMAVDDVFQMARTVTTKTAPLCQVKAKLYMDATLMAFHDSVHRRIQDKNAQVHFFDGTEKDVTSLPEEQKKLYAFGHKSSTSRVRRYDWASVLDARVSQMEVGSNLTVTLAETYPKAPLKDLQAGLLNLSERCFGDKLCGRTRQTKDKKGVTLTRLK